MRKITFVPDNAVLDLEFSGSSAYVDDLVRHFHELVEIERAVVERARQTESVIYKNGFARTIAFIHAADLRNGGVRFIDHHQKIFREKVDDCVGLGAGRTAGQMPRIIFDPIAEAHFLKHFEIVLRPHAQSLGFEKFVLRFKIDNALFEFFANRLQSAIEFIRWCDELFGGVKCHDAKRFVRVTGQRVEPRYRIDLIAEKFDADCFLVGCGGINFNDVAADAESSARKIHVVAFV